MRKCRILVRVRDDWTGVENHVHRLRNAKSNGLGGRGKAFPNGQAPSQLPNIHRDDYESRMTTAYVFACYL